MSVSSRKIIKTCSVCHLTNISRGRWFCEACLSFYKRNKHRQDLVCKAGDKDFRCFIVASPTTTTVPGGCQISTVNDEDEDPLKKMARSGTVWRFLCPACRMAKCLEMNQSNRKTKDKKQQLASAIDKSIDTWDNLQHDQMLSVVVNAAQLFTNMLQSAPSLDSNLNFNNEFEAYQFYSQTIVLAQIEAMKQFASHFDFYRNLNLSDRSKVFLNTRMTMIVGENSIHPTEDGLPKIAAFSNYNFQKFRKVYPESSRIFFDHLQYQADISFQTTQRLDFNPIEKAFFLAFLFFDGNSMAPFQVFCQLLFIFVVSHSQSKIVGKW